jgi:1,4-alpha-glucan branching enzyme
MTAKETAGSVERGQIEALLSGRHHDPHSILGYHAGPAGATVRALQPSAEKAWVEAGGEVLEMQQLVGGLFGAGLPGVGPHQYRLRFQNRGGEWTVDDPYRFLPTLGELDLHLIGEGSHRRLWQKLGSRRVRHEGVEGVAFAVWAPNARGVTVVSDFAFWDEQVHPMRSLGSSGVWELFIPGLAPGARYKYRIAGADGAARLKADPMARAAEIPPGTASVVEDSTHSWADDAWLSRRAAADRLGGPMSIYEVHLGSWRHQEGGEPPGFRELGRQLGEYCNQLGFTHVELMPVMEHPFGGSWGYQVTGYYAPTARFGTSDDFRAMIDDLHQQGIGVILDWVPAHFPRDDWALARFDGTALYEHEDPRRGSHPDWGTLIFNYARAEVRNFLVANALYWADEFHADGLRVDAVASMLYLDYSRKAGEWAPNQFGGRENIDAINFLREVNSALAEAHPGVMMVAEESTAWGGVTRPASAGGLGFSHKWNMGWMHDTLDYLSHDPIYRRYHHSELTFGLLYAWSEHFILPLSHDEVVHGKGSLIGKMPGDPWRRRANLRAMLAWMWAHPGKQLLFMGGEFGQEREWSNERQLDWYLLDDPGYAGIQRVVTDLNRTYQRIPALWQMDSNPDGFAWIDAGNADQNVLSFIRRDADGVPGLVCVANFSAETRTGFRVGVPHGGAWLEVLNTDAEVYGGSNAGNLGRVLADAVVGWNGQPSSVVLTLPPLGVLWLVPETSRAAEPGQAWGGAVEETDPPPKTPAPETPASISGRSLRSSTRRAAGR